MSYTIVDFYRSGNSTSSRLEYVRTDITHPSKFDIIELRDAQNLGWVDVNSGGISVFETPDDQWTKIWKLSAGFPLPLELHVWNDVPGHWSWDPAQKMLLSDYIRVLGSVSVMFTRVK